MAGKNEGSSGDVVLGKCECGQSAVIRCPGCGMLLCGDCVVGEDGCCLWCYDEQKEKQGL
jgi:hypothetical protein